MFSVLRGTRRELLRSFVVHRLRSRYRGAALGVLWALLRPLFTMAILALVVTFFQIQTPYAAGNQAFILVGLIAWLFTAGAISQSCTVLVDESNVIKKVFFPRQILPLAVTLAEVVHFVIALAVLLPLVFVFCRFLPDGWIVLLPGVFAIHVALVYGIGLLVALGNVYFRDVSAILEALLMAWFYFSPVFYSVDLVRHAAAERAPWLLVAYLANPLAGILYGYRLALLHGSGLREGVEALPLSPGTLALCLGWSALNAAVLLVLAHRLYRTHDNRIADCL